MERDRFLEPFGGWAKSMRNHLIGFGALATIVLFGNPASAAPDEFAGPFPSWADVRRDYGAEGDGKTDDTAAVQKALDDLSEHKNFCVLYFPAGTYRLTATVKTTRKAHTDGMCAVVGESPDATILRWDGTPGATLFQYDAWYAKISRLTCDGAGKAGVCLACGDAFSTYNTAGSKTATSACSTARETSMRTGTCSCARRSPTWRSAT
jgi:hypothetical protein